jgi:hypothetical protein
MVALGPLALWMARNSLVAGSATTRQIAFHRLYSVHFLPGWETAAAWVFPMDVYTGLRAAVLGVLVLGLLWGVVRTLGPGPNRLLQDSELRMLPLSLMTFLACYGAFLLFSKIYVDPLFPLDDRILSPAMAALIVAWVLVGWSALHRAAISHSGQPRASRIRVAQGILLGFVLIQLGLGARVCLAWAATAHEKGLGYNSRSWQRSPLVDFVESLPTETVVFSNADDGLLYSTGHPVWRLPAASASASDSPAWIEQIRQRQGMGAAYVVYFDAITWRELISPADIQQHFPVATMLRNEEGVVLQMSPQSEE